MGAPGFLRLRPDIARHTARGRAYGSRFRHIDKWRPPLCSRSGWDVNSDCGAKEIEKSKPVPPAFLRPRRTLFFQRTEACFH